MALAVRPATHSLIKDAVSKRLVTFLADKAVAVPHFRTNLHRALGRVYSTTAAAALVAHYVWLPPAKIQGQRIGTIRLRELHKKAKHVSAS